MQPVSPEKTYSQLVKPWSGHIEDRLVIGLMIAIVIAAAGLLQLFYPAKQNDFVAIPKPILQVLTELSIAAEELSLLVEFGETPELSHLAAEGMPPFARQTTNAKPITWNQQGLCFIGEMDFDEGYQVRLWINSSLSGVEHDHDHSNYRVQWRQEKSLNINSECQVNDGRWISVEKPKNLINSTTPIH